MPTRPGSWSACDPPPDEGLVPAPDDDQLFISFPTVLRLLMLEHRGLCEAMVRQIGPADQLKIEQTLAQGDPAAVEALPLQYCGTPGRRAALSMAGRSGPGCRGSCPGRSRGMTRVSAGRRPPQQPDLAARKRLVSAMLGSAQGQPPAQPVSFGGMKVSPQQFEGWVRDQLSRRRIAAEAASSADSLPVVAAAQPVLFQAAIFGQLNDAAGRGFKGDELPYEFHEVDWTWRHLTVLAAKTRCWPSNARGSRPSTWREERSAGSSPCATAGRPAPCGRWSAGNESTSAPPWPPTGPEWPASTARRAATCGWAIAAARRPAIRSGIAGGSSCSRSDRPANSSPRRCASWNCIPKPATCFPGSRSWRSAEREKLPSECQASWAGNRLVVLVAGSVICDRPARADRLAPPGNDSALRNRPRLRSAALPAGNRIRRAALRPAARKLRDRLPRPGDRPAPLAARHHRLAKHRRSAGRPPPGENRAGTRRLEQDDRRSPLAVRVSRHAVGLRPHDIRPDPCRPASDHRRQAATRIPRDRSGHGTNAGPRRRAAGKEPAHPFRTDHRARRRARRQGI